MTRRNPDSTWLVVLRADALEDWLKANHPGIQRKGPKGYKSLCNSDTSLVAYLLWCSHGVEIGAVDRAFVVSASTGTDAAAKGLKEFNAATAKMYRPLHAMSIERVLPGPVYVAEIYDRETSAVEYEPFTPASKDEMLRGVQERASQYDEGFDLKVAGFSRAPATLGRRFIEGTPENIDFARNRVNMTEAAEEDARDQMDEVAGTVTGPGFSVGVPQQAWSPEMLKAYAKGDENAFDEAYLQFKSRSRAEGHADQVRKSMLPELSKAGGPRKLTGNPYKAVIPIVSGIAYVENPIPELVKGSRTPYLRYTRDWEFLAPQSRDRAYEEEVAKTAGVWAPDVSVFRALGSGLHWVGVALWKREEMEDYTELELAITLQSGKSWSVPENKVLRWLNTPADKPGQHDQTGAGGVDFLRWVLAYVEHRIKVSKRVLESSGGPYAPKPHRIVVGWADPKRERAYAWLTRLGFRKVADSGNGEPAYILNIEKPMNKSNPTDLAGRHIPDRYLAGLPPALQKQRVRELTESRDAYKRGDYSELATDVTARKMGLVKQSKYTTEAKKRGVEYRGNAEDMAKRVLMVYSGRAPAQEVAAFAEALRKSFSRGLAAWKSGGHRPGASQPGWAIARVNSLVVGGKTSWTADKKLFAVLPEAVRSKIESMRTTPAPARRNPKSIEVEQLLALTTLGTTKGKPFIEYATGRLQKEVAKQKVITGSSVTQKGEIQQEFVQNAVNAMLAALEPGGIKQLELQFEVMDFLPLHRKREAGTVLTADELRKYTRLRESLGQRLRVAYNRGVEAAKVEKEVEEVGGLSKYKLTRAACADHAKRKANALNAIRSQLFPPAESEYNIAQYAYADMDQSERLQIYQARKTLCEERPTRTTLYDVPHVENDAEDDVAASMLALAATVDNLLRSVYTETSARTDAEVRKKRAGLSALKLFMDRLHDAEFGMRTAEPGEVLRILRQGSRELNAADAKVLLFEVAEGAQRRLEGLEDPQLVERRQKVLEAKAAAPQITTSRSNRR